MRNDPIVKRQRRLLLQQSLALHDRIVVVIHPQRIRAKISYRIVSAPMKRITKARNDGNTRKCGIAIMLFRVFILSCFRDPLL